MSFAGGPLLGVTRPQNCVAAALATLLGVYLGGGPEALAFPLPHLAAVVVGLVVALGNVVNDLRDVEIDRIQKANRPLPSGRLTWNAALALAGLLGTSALALSLAFDAPLFAIVVCALALSAWYSFRLKSTVLIGNAVVAGLSSSTILFGALVAGGVTAGAGFAAGMVFFFMLGREILKDIADHDGDRASGVVTVATRLGPAASLRILGLASAAFAAAAVLPWGLGMAPATYLVATSLLALGPTLAVVGWFILRPHEGNLKVALLVTKVSWFGGLGAMCLLR